jgi:hypothetical protein
MGNEGSIPQETEDVDEQLEYQAKAPPSATNPPGVPPHPSQLSNGMSSPLHAVVGGTTATATTGGTTGGGKGRLMGSVFTRRGHAHNHNSTGIERTIEVAASYPPSQYSNNGNNSHAGITNTTTNNNTAASSSLSVVPMPGEELTYMSADSSAGFYHPQHHHHLHHGPPPPSQPIYLQQQQQQQQHGLSNPKYNQQQQQQRQEQHGAALRMPNQDEDRTVGVVMYSSSNHTNDRTGLATATTTTTTAAAVNAAQALGKKSRRAGAGLISSMRNLSLGFGSAITQSPSRPTSATAARQHQVNEWETRWDEDVDDDEEEEEDNDDDEEEEVEEEIKVDGIVGGKESQHEPEYNQTSIHPPPPLHPQMRPDMDSGYASAASAKAALISSPMPELQSYPQLRQQHHVPLVSPQPASIGSQPLPPPHAAYISTPQQKAHLVTATPDTPSLPLPPLTVAADDDGVEWDTGMQQGDTQQGLSEKPNVEQFLPLLRVLGKGSFGKVCCFSCFFFVVVVVVVGKVS